MEELNKNQIVLLVLLVSFVTSIATGIVTVTLLDQAPPAVTQTINRIVERTVEKVVPGETQVSTVIKEVPVIVTEEELIVKVINGATPGVLKIVSGDEAKTFVSSGFLISTDGVIVASGLELNKATTALKYHAILADGQVIPLKRLVEGEEKPLARGEVAPKPDLSFFKLLPTTVTESKWPTLTLAKVAPTIGQSIVALGYADQSDVNVSVGIVSSFLSSGNASTTPYLITNAASNENKGGPLLNIKGEVVGLSKGPGLAVSVEMITKLVALVK